MLRYRTRPHLPLARALTCAAVLAAAVATCPWPAAAQTDMAAAGKAFSQAQAAELREDWRKAATLYELAARIAPSPEAMRGALRARRKAGNDAKAATWALELRRKHPTDGPSRELASKTLDELRAKLTKLRVRCTPSPCTLEIDAQAVGTEALSTHRIFVAPGSHQLTAGFGSRRTEPQQVEAAAGGDAELSFEEPAVPSGGPAAASSDADDDTYAAVDQPATTSPTGADTGGGGLPPAVAITAMVITAGLGGVTIWSGLDTLGAADDYEQAPTAQGYDDGTGKELRTNVLIGATAAVGVATLAITIFATDWGSSAEPDDAAAAVLPVIAPGQLGASWQTRF